MSNRESSHKSDHTGNDTMKDPLTGIYNRKYFMERLPVELLGASIHNIPFSVVYVNVTDIALIENTYGHSATDTVRLKIVEMIEGLTHKGRDWLARYSDRDFLLCMPGKEKNEAIVLVARLRNEVGEMKHWYNGGEFDISAAFYIYCSTDSVSNFLLEDILKQIEEANEPRP